MVTTGGFIRTFLVMAPVCWCWSDSSFVSSLLALRRISRLDGENWTPWGVAGGPRFSPAFGPQTGAGWLARIGTTVLFIGVLPIMYIGGCTWVVEVEIPGADSTGIASRELSCCTWRSRSSSLAVASRLALVIPFLSSWSRTADFWSSSRGSANWRLLI